MRSLSPRERKLAGVTLAVVAGAILFAKLIDPQLARHAALQAEVSRRQMTLARMQANLRLKDRIEHRYEQLKDLMLDSGSSSEEMSRLARRLSELYGPLALEVRSVQPMPDSDEGFCRKFTWRIEMTGPIPEVVRFLAGIAEVADPIRVERADLSCQERPEEVTASLVVTKIATPKSRGL